MDVTTVLATAVVLAGAAFGLTGWLRGSVASADSAWWARWPQVWLAAGLGALGAMAANSVAQLATFGLVALGLALLVAVDLAEQRLPDVLTLPLYPVLFAGLAVDTWVSGRPWDDWLRALACAAAVAGLFFVLVLLGPFYLGDVKLGGVVGGLLGWFGWGPALFGVVAGFGVHALVGIVLVLLRRASLKTELAFGPSLVTGAVLGPLVLSLLR